MSELAKSFTRRFPAEIGLLGLLYLFLLKDLQNDSRMQGSLGLNALAALAFVVLAAIAITMSWSRSRVGDTVNGALPAWRVMAFGLLAPAGLSLGTLIYQQHFYTSIGYHLTWVGYALTSLSVLLLLIAAIGSWYKQSIQFLKVFEKITLPAPILMALAVFTVIRATEIVSFPLLPGRADMLPLIQLTARSFILGAPPYQMYLLSAPTPHATPVGYLPIMWLMYLPTEVLHIDPRWMGVLAMLLIVGLLFSAAGRATNAGWMIVLLTVVVNPYDALRHDLYLLPYLALLAVALYAFGAKRWVLGSIAFALVLAARQTAIVLIPFYLIVLAMQRGLAQAALHLLLIAAVVAAVVGPFLVWQRETFLYSIVGGTLRWSSTVATLDSTVTERAGQRAAESLALPERPKGFSLIPPVSLVHSMRPADQPLWMAAGMAIYACFVGLCLLYARQPVQGLGFMGFGVLAFVLFVAGDEVHYAREVVMVLLFLAALAYRQPAARR